VTQPCRLPEGGRIDRARPISFTWDGSTLQGFQGDTLASALLANGVHLVGRSFKYHRPRGILAAGSEEPNALVQLSDGAGREDPNTRATQVLLREGLVAASQNRWPSLRLDFGALNGLMSPLWSAGFYYKTFMWPRRAWNALYEPLIRRAAGLGRAPSQADPDEYCTRYAHCDVLIVGAGPAGLAAALAASERGERVILCDEQHELGGTLLSSGDEEVEHRRATDWLAQTLSTLRSRDSVTCLSSTTAFGYYADNMLGLVQDLSATVSAGGPRQQLWQVRAKEVVLATGSIERPLVFPDNDRPGVMLAGAARTYLNRYAVRVGERIVVYAADDSGYRSALDLQARARCVQAIVDPRPNGSGSLKAAASNAGIEVLGAHAVVSTQGRLRVSAARICALNSSGEPAGAERTLACDSLLMAGGWTPTVHLFSQTRAPLEWEPNLSAFVPGQATQNTWVAGACRGSVSTAQCIMDGYEAGSAAAKAATGAPRSTLAKRTGDAATSPTSTAPDTIAKRPKAFLDFQNDVCATDIAQALTEGFRSIEHVKRYTTTGMATDQGKTSNLNALGLASRLLEKPPVMVGTTTFRAPYTPVTFGALAGEHRGQHLDPVRTTPMHEWARAAGAVFEPVRLWQRARYFPKPGEDMHQAVLRECRITRERAGIFDASTLGKIELVGPDAAVFLERMYTNAWARLEVGRCRYGLLLKEDGYVFDDGVIGRIAHDRFHITTTTGGAPRVLHHMEDYLQTEFQDLRVWLTSTTEEWAVIAVNGPLARQILEPLVEGIDLRADAFPHMAVREGRICGTRTRLFRVSFTGELGFEVNVPSADALPVWEAIHREGLKHGAVCYGTETMHVLRAEKGYIIIGQETDGTVTPHDLGLDWAIGASKKDFVGKRSLSRADLQKPDRPQLVGLLTCDGRTLLDEGAQILTTPRGPGPKRSAGHVTSSYFSAALGRPIALALLAGGRKLHGKTVRVTALDGEIDAEVVPPVFYDVAGDRLRA
jgi:sarcosine oxidase subunit alpha